MEITRIGSCSIILIDMMKSLILLSLCCITESLNAATPGTPENPIPTNVPHSWVTWSNDWLGMPSGKQADDNRTNGLTVVGNFNNFTFAVEHSMLTKIPPSELLNGKRLFPGTRIDELYFSLGKWERLLETVHVNGGVGYRMRGDFFGKAAQNCGHKNANGLRVDAIYEDAQDTLYGYGLVNWQYESLWTSASVVLDTRLEIASDVAALLLFQKDDDKFPGAWIGARYKYRNTDSCDVINAVASFENGLWFDFGINMGGYFSYSSSVKYDREGSIGYVTIQAEF